MTGGLTESVLWPVILGMGLITFALRASLIVMWERIELPPFVNEALRYVPPAVLSAIIFPELFAPGQPQIVPFLNVRVVAGALAAILAWRTRNVVLTLAAGMGALWLMQAILR